MPAPLRNTTALRLLHELALGQVRDGEPDLTQRQLTILLTVFLDPPPHTVRGLAAKLGVTKPVVTRALDTMGKLGLLVRQHDELDRRNIVVVGTPKGQNYLERLAGLIAVAVEDLAR